MHKNHAETASIEEIIGNFAKYFFYRRNLLN